MTPSEKIREIAAEDRVLLVADILYVIAFALISVNYSFGWLEIVFLLLVLGSLGSLVYTVSRGVSPQTHGVLTVVHILVGAVISVRYAVHFVTDLTYLSVLVLFMAVIGLGYAAVVKLLRLARSGTRAAPVTAHGAGQSSSAHVTRPRPGGIGE